MLEAEEKYVGKLCLRWEGGVLVGLRGELPEKPPRDLLEEMLSRLERKK